MIRDPRVVVPSGVRRAVLAHARAEAPRECCGLLVGRGGQVLAAVACRNLARGTKHYRLSPREHIDLRRTLRGFRPRLVILGVYHSHPAGAAVPSPTDLAEANYPEWIQMIVGLGGERPQLRAYRFSERRVLPVRLIPRVGRRRLFGGG